MKQRIPRAPLFCVVLCLVLSGQFLAKDRKSLTIYEKSRVNDVVLEPGDYKVEVAERGDSVELMIYKGKELVAKAPAQPERLDKKPDRNTVRLALEGDKAPKIIELRLSGHAQSYKLGDGAQVSQKAK